MGCTVSKLDNDDTVQRCKERRHLMREAVYARHHLAAAHFDYCTSLRLTGSALVAFASGEPLLVSDHTPAVLLRTSTPTPTPIPTSATKPPTFVPPSHHHSPYTTPSPSVRPPPPPPMSTTSSHHHQKPPPQRRRKPIKLPHILSDSSISSSPPPNHNFTYNARANSTYSNTPSQTSSEWNWDNFYPPPSPPDSEFFHKLHNSKKSETRVPNANSDDDDHHDKASNFTSYSSVRRQNPVGGVETKQFDDGASNYSSYSHYSDNNHVKNQIPIPVLMRKAQNSKQWESSEEEAEREEVQCSEWGDHDNYTYTSSSGDENDDLKSRSDFRTRSNIGSVKNDGNEKMDANSKFSSISEKLSSEEDDDDDDGKSFANWRNGVNSEGVNSDRRIVVRHRDLSEIVEALNEYFDKAASAGDQVSEILEAGPAQLDRSFKQLRKTIYHSSGMLSNLSSTWTSKPPLAVKYRFEQSSDSKSLCSTLERILAWETKLYQEVKAREGVKLENERKLSALQSQEYRGEDEAKVDKTKASIKRLQSLQLVTSQAVSATSFAIIGLRDSDLVPQLVELCRGFMYMWRSMNRFHQLQNDIVQQIRGLVGPTTKPTTDLHRQATRDLESAVATWHSSFCRAIKFHRDFIRSLHGWFKLTLVPVNPESTHAEKSQPSEVFAFLDEWKLVLERAPDTVASEAIKSFNSVVRSISTKQSEELKIKKRAELASRDLEKRASSLRNIERKYYESYSMVGVGPAGDGVLDGRDPLSEKKAELITWRRRVEDEMNKHMKAVEVTRAMTMNNIQTGLPGVFHAMTGFSALITEALDTVCTKSYAI